MNDIHMGELLERAIRRKGLNITEIAAALNITRRTLYNWFKQDVIDEHTMERISKAIKYDLSSENGKPAVVKNIKDESSIIKDETYWQDRYIDLLEQYSLLIADTASKK
ncbi:MAG: XRE family transcriptional regulator [Flavobacterium sp.]|nr:MAG: XRE family transcriptional regulator [Flavobacterium sp.]